MTEMNDKLIVLTPYMYVCFSNTERQVYFKIMEKFYSKGYFIVRVTSDIWKFLLTPEVLKYVTNLSENATILCQVMENQTIYRDILSGYKLYFDGSDYGSLGIRIKELNLTIEIWVKPEESIINLYIGDNKIEFSIDAWKDILKLRSKITNHLLGNEER